jgi:hypothetical protein
MFKQVVRMVTTVLQGAEVTGIHSMACLTFRYSVPARIRCFYWSADLCHTPRGLEQQQPLTEKRGTWFALQDLAVSPGLAEWDTRRTQQSNYNTYHRNKKFREELIANVSWYDMDRTENESPTRLLLLRVTFVPSRCLATTGGYAYRQIDGWDLWGTSLRWARVSWYTYQVW